MNNNLNDFKRAAVRNMGNNNLESEDDMIFDGQSHEYWAYINGEHLPARYTAILHPFETKRKGPALICNYGLVNSSEQYTYSSANEK